MVARAECNVNVVISKSSDFNFPPPELTHRTSYFKVQRAPEEMQYSAADWILMRLQMWNREIGVVRADIQWHV